MQRVGMFFLLAWFCAGAASQVCGRPPDIRLPDWYKSEFSVKSWDPTTREIRVAFSVEAVLVPLQELSASIAWPAGFTGKTTQASSVGLRKGETWTVEFRANGPTTFDGWVELIASARPDPVALKKVIEATATYTPGVKAILEEEVRALAKPIPIGLNTALHLDEGLALNTPTIFIPAPNWPLDGTSLHLWLPVASCEHVKPQDDFVAFGHGVRFQDAGKAIKAAKALLGYFSGPEPVRFFPMLTKNAPPVQLNQDLIRQLLSANIEALEGLTATPADLAGRLKALAGAKRGFVDPFRAANLGALFARKGDSKGAAEAWRLALDLSPAWPLVQGWQKRSGSAQDSRDGHPPLQAPGELRRFPQNPNPGNGRTK